VIIWSCHGTFFRLSCFSHVAFYKYRISPQIFKLLLSMKKGIFGAKLSEIFCRACEPNRTLQEKVGHAMRKHQLVLAGGGVLLVLVFSFIPFVDWAAHLGGMLTGMAVGLILFSCDIRSYLWKACWFLVGLGLTIGGFWTSLTYMYSGNVEIVEQLRDVCDYYQQMMGDNEYECTCTLDQNNDG